MKKIFTLLASALFAASMSATDYTGPLSVSLNGETTPSGETVVSMTEGSDGTCNLSLKNFSFAGMPIGTINLTNVEMDKSALVTVFGDNKQLTIDKGDDPNVQMWFGPSMGPMSVFVKGSVQNGKLNAVILIDMTASDFGIIKVLFGKHAEEVGQIANSGFERFHAEKIGSKSGQEPYGWHSFLSCDGTLATMAGGSHTEPSNDVRPGNSSSNKQSLKVFSSAINIGLIKKSANGTVTTGRIAANSATESDPSNHSYLDMTNTATDGAGDPFYTALVGMPDSISVWVKYVPAKEGITATMSAAITDGTYYQDPEDKKYSNVCAKASNSAIAANDGKWQYITVPFDYSAMAANDMLKARGILVTMSTCSVPGGGSTDTKKADELYIDDMRLVYNCAPLAITYNGEVLPGFRADKFEYDIKGTEPFDVSKLDSDDSGVDNEVSVSVVEGENGSAKAYYTVISGDYQQTLTYTINYTVGDPSAISSAKTGTANGNAGIYDLSGRRVKASTKQGVFIVRTADGKTFKMMNK